MPSGVYKRTKEHRAITSAAIKKIHADPNSVYNSEEYQTKRTAAMNLPKVKAKKSVSQKQLWQDLEYRIKQCNSQSTGQNRLEVKAKKSVVTKKLWQDPGYRGRQVASQKIAQLRPEVRIKKSDSIKKLHADPNSDYNSEEYREKLVVTRKRLWQDPIYREKQLKVIFKGLNLRPNKPEKFLIKLLQELISYEWRYTGNGSFTVGLKRPDFINLKQKKIIEYNSNYWHSEAKTGRTKEQEGQQRIEYFAKYGYKTLVIWEDELGNVESLCQKIVNFCIC